MWNRTIVGAHTYHHYLSIIIWKQGINLYYPYYLYVCCQCAWDMIAARTWNLPSYSVTVISTFVSRCGLTHGGQVKYTYMCIYVCIYVLYICQWTGSSLAEVMARHICGTQELHELMLMHCQPDAWEQTSVNFESKYTNLHTRKQFENVSEMSSSLFWSQCIMLWD